MERSTVIPVIPNSVTTITDETTEHLISHRRTIQIDRDYLRRKYPELFERLAKVAEKCSFTPKKKLVKKQGNGHVKK